MTRHALFKFVFIFAHVAMAMLALIYFSHLIFQGFPSEMEDPQKILIPIVILLVFACESSLWTLLDGVPLKARSIFNLAVSLGASYAFVNGNYGLMDMVDDNTLPLIAFHVLLPSITVAVTKTFPLRKPTTISS